MCAVEEALRCARGRSAAAQAHLLDTLLALLLAFGAYPTGRVRADGDVQFACASALCYWCRGTLRGNLVTRSIRCSTLGCLAPTTQGEDDAAGDEDDGECGEAPANDHPNGYNTAVALAAATDILRDYSVSGCSVQEGHRFSRSGVRRLAW